MKGAGIFVAPRCGMTDRATIIGKFWNKLDDSPVVMIGLRGQEAHSEPMTVHFDSDFFNRLYLFLAHDNRLCEGLASGSADAMLQFVSKGHDFFACLHGKLSRITDPKMLDRFWSKKVEAWFEQGRNDPKLAMVCVELVDAEMWEAELPLATKMKLMFGGDVDKDEVRQKHAQVAMS